MSKVGLDAVSYSGTDYVAHCTDTGTWIDIEAHDGKSSFSFSAERWLEIQATVNAAIEGFKRLQEEAHNDD